MRIAISGTHFVGKTTLISALLKRLPKYTFTEEPYRSLEAQGYEFSVPPTIDDFEHQLDDSIQSLIHSRKNTLFDRCPLDFLAYAEILSQLNQEEEIFDIQNWLEKIETPIQKLDLIIFVPIETRIRLPSSEDSKLHKMVDAKLQEILLEDCFSVLENMEILEVTGSIEKRVELVIEKIHQMEKEI